MHLGGRPSVFQFLRSALSGGDKPPPLHEDKSEPQNPPPADCKHRIPNVESLLRRTSVEGWIRFRLRLRATTPQDDPTGRSVELQKKAGINRRPYTKIKANRRISNTEYRMSKYGFASGFAFGYDPTGRSVFFLNRPFDTKAHDRQNTLLRSACGGSAFSQFLFFD